ncbi:hypothetical protein AcW1_004190 [Taiwanofungus camphoratus]|nr:hypothetical protein AcW2_006793 [Antrodia cinnamomea]KAI0951968.1 hypothetical protein AcV7_007912 [Antrodia cinnamomea]KAI0959340.1 hypothetical protein AcW1_004190 [Antrodia cinnamomea]
MPRENRKRGKKHKKKTDEAETRHHEAPHESEQPSSAGPSWIVSAPEAFEVNQEAPFGYVDVQIKTYFRTVDLQIREWQESKAVVEEDGDVDPNEDRHLFFVAALTEMSGKEKQLATDPDCSSILERMIYSMDDFARRVFMDRLSGSFEQLIRHRFASHVCQTLFTVTSETVSRESRGIFPPALNPPEDGELRTMSQLVVDACEELLPAFTSLLMDSFASHVLRALLLLLDPNSFALDGGSSASYAKTALYVRSKKSAEYKARQGPMKSVFTDNDAQNEKDPLKHVPQTFYETAHKFVLALRDQLDDNEVRALAANQVASPVLQMLLEVEAAHDIADVPKSLMDRALVGLITLSHTDPSAIPEPSDYLGTLLRDPTASHLLEALVRRVPQKVFDVLWSTYFKEQLPKLAVHPVANFVVAQALKRVSVEQMDDVFEKLDGALGKIIKASRIGVLNVMVDRVACLQAQEERVMQTICSAFKLTAPDDKALVVPCILRVQPREDYQAALSARADQAAMKEGEPSKKKARGRASADDNDPLEPKTQGALLLQAMLRLPVPHNELVLDRLFFLCGAFYVYSDNPRPP